MNAQEYSELVLKARDDLFAALRAALPAECEMEKRYILSGREAEVNWPGALVNRETDRIRILVLLMNNLGAANAEKVAGARNFQPSLRLSFELFHDYLQGSDAVNTQEVFEADLLKIQFAIETNKSLPPKGYIENYQINFGIRPSVTRALHYGRGEITINFRAIQYAL